MSLETLALDKLHPFQRASGKDTRFIIIGAGISGVLMAIKLRERGLRNIVVLEKAETLGGTWRDNTYPGVACDVAAHLYSYSFARNPWWQKRYARGPDILKYHQAVARRHGVLPFIRYGEQVQSATFDGAVWTVTTHNGEQYQAEVVIGATGRLHHPTIPNIAGADDFAGPSFHTARWDHSIDLSGKRVGLIGTGSTATQIITTLAGTGPQLKIFQRTAQWVFPVKDTKVPWWRRLAYKLSGAFWQRYYLQLQSETETRGKAATGSAEGRMLRDKNCTDALAAISDPVLRAKLTPDYEVGCKRLVFSDGFYAAIQHPGVDVITDAIDHIEARGVVTRDGTLHPIDVLVFATGFDAHAYLRPMQVTGADGVTLDEVWRDLPLTYQSITVPHMPNFLLINGPYSPGGSASVVGIAEAQVDYILRLIDRIVDCGVLLMPRTEVAQAWLEGVREQARGSVWGTGGCTSWYLDETGTPTLDPSSLSELQARLEKIDFEDFIEWQALDQSVEEKQSNRRGAFGPTPL